MKLKDHPQLSPKHLWVQWGMTERKQGQHGPIDHPNMRQEQFCKEALILNVEPLREHQLGAPTSLDRTSVVINVKHPEYDTGVTGTIVVRSGDKQLAGNLLQTAQKFLGKTVEELGEAEVTDEMLLTSELPHRSQSRC